MLYQFPLGAVQGIQIQEPYYCETLDMDITGRREKQQVLKALGLQEAGDAVKGAREFDHKAPVLIDKQPPRGRTLADVQRDKERAAQHEMIVGIEDKSGRITPVSAKDLPSFNEVQQTKRKKHKEQHNV